MRTQRNQRLFFNSHITHASFSILRLDVTKTEMGNGKLKLQIENGKVFTSIVDDAGNPLSGRLLISKLHFSFCLFVSCTAHFLHSVFSILRTPRIPLNDFSRKSACPTQALRRL